jgi:hypothetical protein
MKKAYYMLILCLSVACVALATDSTIPKDAKVYIAPMDGFESDLRTAIVKKHVPVQIVDKREDADYEIVGTSESQKASTAKKVFMWDWHSNEQASFRLTNLKTSEVVYSYSVNKPSSAHGKRSTAEACAKHLKEHVR